ncbi:MAG TPA: type II toxin-antitoxin system VapC family toxin [Clostridiales bacterium]|nr:type II toxin-antitoxin system VapC family toxin [Clostridiales bacterium]
MKFLLDTCVISELIKKAPDKNVTEWISKTDENLLYISVITVGEITKGIEKISDSNRKAELVNWVELDLKKRFENKIIPFGIDAAKVWGKVQALSENLGRTLPAIDGIIASIGIADDLTVVTRNISDMKESGAALFNPWNGEYFNI